MHRAQLIFTPRQGPAMELLRLAQGDSRVAPLGWDGGNKEARVKAFLGLHEAGTQNACAAVLIQQSS